MSVMNILAINCGSSSLKFALFAMGDGAGGSPKAHRLLGGAVSGIGGQARIRLRSDADDGLEEAVSDGSYDGALRAVLDRVHDAGLPPRQRVDAVGHRVVHGGEQFRKPERIDATVMAGIEAVSALAPLHNAPALSAIHACRALLGDDVPMVATFDTAFHGTLPEHATTYAIPHDWVARHGIRRFGFHGLAHRWMAERYTAVTGVPMEQTKLITLQLGNGCSATAIQGGRSLDTSMGFTPLEGLMMGTRAGDLDPSIPGLLAQQEDISMAEVEHALNTRSGLLGVSGQSPDMRVLLERQQGGNHRAALAIEMFCYRVRKYIGAYLAVLGGADAVVFGGGIGEHEPLVRRRICAHMAWCGLTLDEGRNEALVGTEGRISTAGSTLHAYVLPVDEESLLARDTVNCLRREGT